MVAVVKITIVDGITLAKVVSPKTDNLSNRILELATWEHQYQAIPTEQTMSLDIADHGLPLVSLKEQRRDLIMSRRGLAAPLSRDTIFEIASLQSAIAAIEAVISDLDDEIVQAEAWYRPQFVS